MSITTEISSTAHVYELDGDYLVTLQVIDEDGGQSEILSALIQVYSGAQPVIVQENLTESGRVFYHGGDELRFSVQRQGGKEGLHPIQPYAWTILLNHNEHSHYLLAEYINDDVILQVPTKTHALNSPLWYQVQLTMNTANGQKIQRTLDVVPQTTTIQVQSWPAIANIMIDHQVQPPEAQTLVIVGQEYTLEAPQNVIHNGMVGEFTNWVVTPSWPLASAETATVIVTDRVYTLVATAEANTYVAFYEYVRSARNVYLPGVHGPAFAR
jgi:hypothetical protein